MRYTYVMFIIIGICFIYHRNDEIKLFICIEIFILTMVLDILIYSQNYSDPDAVMMIIVTIVGATVEACIGLSILAYKSKLREIEKRNIKK